MVEEKHSKLLAYLCTVALCCDINSACCAAPSRSNDAYRTSEICRYHQRDDRHGILHSEDKFPQNVESDMDFARCMRHRHPYPSSIVGRVWKDSGACLGSRACASAFFWNRCTSRGVAR